MKHRNFWAGASILCLTALTATAWAQQGPPQTGSQRSATQPADDDLVSDEIVVNARKRAESQAEAPVSVSVLTAGALQDFVIEDTDDILRQAPGLTLVNAGPAFTNEISIRGQGGGRVGFSEAATGIYRDGHYIAGGGFGGRSLSTLDLYDVQNVEILRGPQGALFGRNAVGGAINVVTRRPTDEWGFSGEFGFDNFERLQLRGTVNAPLTDTLALRVGGFFIDQNDGFITQLSTGDVIDQRGDNGLRAQLQFSPSDRTNLRLIFEFRDSFDPSFSTLGFRPFRAAIPGPLGGSVLDPEQFVRNLDTISRVDIQEYQGFAEFTHEFPWAVLELRASTKFRDGIRSGDDLDHFLGFQGVSSSFPPTPPNPQPINLVVVQSEDFERAGGEILLRSPDDNGSPIHWLFGAEYQFNSSSVITDTTGFAGNFAGLRAQLRTDSSNETLNSWSVYGSFEYDFTDRLSVGIETRVQGDSKDFFFFRVANAPASLSPPITIPDEDQSFVRVTPAFTTRFSLTEDVSVFGRVATGFRPGGFNLGIPPDLPVADAEDLLFYGPEYGVSAEFGVKASLFDGLIYFEGAIFNQRTFNVQIVTQPSATNTTFILQNGGDSNIWGVELQANTRFNLLGGTMTIGLGASTNQGQFLSGTEALINGAVVDLSGNRINRTRDFIGQANFVYRRRLFGPLDWFVTGNFQTQQGGFEDATNTDNFESFEVFDFRAGLNTEHWNLSFFVQNATNQIYRIQELSANDFLNTPRSYGLRLSFNY
jgi:Outer membrane receptor proteins, mostly Fe transport